MVLEEAVIMIVGYERDTKEKAEHFEYKPKGDPRFIDNPHGIGSSKAYEAPYDSSSSSLSTSPASRRSLTPQETNTNESDGLLSSPKPRPSKTESIDLEKGKRKGRMPGDSADDRYKVLLAGPASQAKALTKIFTLKWIRH